jgi:hypothetical protein
VIHGFLSPSSSVPLEQVRTRIELAYGFAVATPEIETEPPPLRCPHCGGKLIYWLSILPQRDRRATAELSLALPVPSG